MISFSLSIKIISNIPLAAPKFPSIWNGGCISSKLSFVECSIISLKFLYTSSLSSNLHQKFIIHALLHPVCPPPFSVLVLIVFLHASLNSLSIHGLIKFPGNKPYKWDICLWPFSTSSKSSIHSWIRPSLVILTSVKLFIISTAFL